MRSVVLAITVGLASLTALVRQDATPAATLRRLTGVEWIAGPPWRVESPEWSCVHGLRTEWFVDGDSATGSLRVERRLHKRPHGNLHRTGPVYGSNSGEFGGDVRWVRGQADTVVLVPENWVQYLPVDSGTYVLAGLAHMTMSRGSLWLLKSEQDVWSSRKVANLGDEPQVGMIEDSNVVVVTLRSLVIVSLRDGKTDIRLFDRWYAAYANSIVRGDDGWLYIGLRQGIARVRQTGDHQEAEWLVPRALADSLRRGCR